VCVCWRLQVVVAQRETVVQGTEGRLSQQVGAQAVLGWASCPLLAAPWQFLKKLAQSLHQCALLLRQIWSLVM
jgi:hypothetical protein